MLTPPWYSLHRPLRAVDPRRKHTPGAIRYPPLGQTAHIPSRKARLARCSPHWFLADVNTLDALPGKSWTDASYRCQKTRAKLCLIVTVNESCLCPIVFGRYWSRLRNFSSHPPLQPPTRLDHTVDATSVSAFSARLLMFLKLLHLPPLQNPFLLSQLVLNSQRGSCVENTPQNRLSRKMKVIHTHIFKLSDSCSDPNRSRLDHMGKLSAPPNTRPAWTPLLAIC